MSSNFFHGLLPHLIFNTTELQTISRISLVIFLRVSTCLLVQVLNLSANACTGESSILIGATLHESCILLILSLQTARK
ncbi:hypothetical protein Bca4012_083034 [Brassica carinata]